MCIEFIVQLVQKIRGREPLEAEAGKKRIKGSVVLMKKNVLDFNDFHGSLRDRVDEFLNKRVSLQLISAENVDSGQFSLLLLLFFSVIFDNDAKGLSPMERSGVHRWDLRLLFIRIKGCSMQDVVILRTTTILLNSCRSGQERKSIAFNF